MMHDNLNNKDTPEKIFCSMQNFQQFEGNRNENERKNRKKGVESKVELNLQSNSG